MSNSLAKKEKIYFIGIKGSGMAALAEIFHAEGYVVSGSDTDETFFTDEILKKKLWIKFHEKFSANHITDDIGTVVYSTAYNEENNPEIRAAKEQGLKMFSYPEMLGKLFSKKYGIAVCGTHGKTTTTAMLAEIMNKAGLDPTAVVGSQVTSWRGSALAGRSEFMIIEADEYQNKFVFYDPKALILTNADWDHPDFFPNQAEYFKVFHEFVRKIPKYGFMVTCGDRIETLEISKSASCKVLTYGFSSGNSLQIKNHKIDDGRQYFDFVLKGKKLGEFELMLPGVHNVLNAAAAAMMAMQFNADVPAVKEALSNFEGTSRRFEYIGERNGAILIDDYAHHPEEIKATLNGARDFFPKRRIWCVFHPHTFTRTSALIDDFAQSFQSADKVIILDIYGSAREKQGGVHSKELVEKAKKFHHDLEYIATIDEAVAFLKDKIGGEDLVVVMGAGDVWKVAEKLKNSN